MTYKTLPIDKKVIEQMKISTPDLYNDMVNRYGEENVINNLLVDYIVLTEDKNIVLGKDKTPILVTKDLIDTVEKASNRAFERYLKEPSAKLKSFILKGDKTLGYTPIILEHLDSHISGRQGFIIGGSYKKGSIDGKWHLFCKGVLINPEAKMKYLQGLYREVSPTIIGRDNTIDEVSFVNRPAQMTNTSLSAPIEEIMIAPLVADEWAAKIQQAKMLAELEAQEYKIKQKENTAKHLTEQLLKKGVITSSQRNRFENVFIQLSSGEESLVANALAAVGASPLNRKPRNVFLKGTIDMDKTKDERFLAFSAANKSKYANDLDLMAAFNKQEAQTNISLSSGEGSLSDPIEDIRSQLDALKTAGTLTDEHKKMLAAYCGHENVQLADGDVGNGKSVDAGTEIGIPNNTSLSAPNEASNAHLEMLEKGFEATKAEAAAFKARAEAAEAQLAGIKQSLGVN